MAAVVLEQFLQAQGDANPAIEEGVPAVSGVYAAGTLCFRDVATGKVNRIAAAGDTFLGFVAATVTAVADEGVIHYEAPDFGSRRYLFTLAGGIALGDHRKAVYCPLGENDPDLCRVDAAGQTNWIPIGRLNRYHSATQGWVRCDDRSGPEPVGTA